MVPTETGTLAMCWLCAHFVTAHDHEVGGVIDASVCTCKEADIFPPDIAELRKLRRDREEARDRGELLDRDRTQSDGVPDFVEQPEHVGRHSKRWAGMTARRAGRQLFPVGTESDTSIDCAPTIELRTTVPDGVMVQTFDVIEPAKLGKAGVVRPKSVEIRKR